MELHFLDERIETIDAVVREAEARHFGERADDLQAEADIRLMLAALGRDIAARQLPRLSRLEIGSIYGTSPEAESFEYMRSEGKRGGRGGICSSDHFGVSIGQDGSPVHFYQNAVWGYRNEPLRRLLDDFHAGDRRCFNDGIVLLEGITVPTRRLGKGIDMDRIMREVEQKLSGRKTIEPRAIETEEPPLRELPAYVISVARQLPRHGEHLIKLSEAWQAVNNPWTPRVEDPPYLTEAYTTAAKAVITYFQETGEGLFVPDEGLTVGYYNNNPGQPVRLFPDRQLYIQLPLLQESSFWRRKLVVVAPKDYQVIRGSDLVVRGLLTNGETFSGKPHVAGIIEEYKRVVALTSLPNPMEHITSSGYNNLRHFAHLHLGQGIDPADQKTLWFNGGQPANHVTEYQVPEKLREYVDLQTLNKGPGVIEGVQRRLQG
jgi:hypothetical protein